MKKRLLFLLLCVYSGLSTTAQNKCWDGYFNKRDVKALLRTADTLWVGTSTGLVMLNPETKAILGEYNEYNSPIARVESLITGPDGTVWCAGFGLFKRKGTAWERYDDANGNLSRNVVTTLAFDTDGKLWVGTYHAGVFCVDRFGKWTNYNKTNSPIPDNLTAKIQADAQGNIWMAFGDIYQSNPGGVARLSPTGQWQVFQKANGTFPSTNATNLLIDRQGKFWAAGRSDLWCLNPTDSTWQKTDLAPNGYIYAMQQGLRDDIWVGFSGKLAHWDNGVWTYTDIDRTYWVPSGIASIALEADGQLWLGDRSNGLRSLEGPHLKSVKINAHGFEGAALASMAQSSDGQTACVGAGYGGFFTFKGGQWQQMESLKFGLVDRWVAAIEVVSDTLVYLGVKGYFDSALLRFNGSKMDTLNLFFAGLGPESISINQIVSVGATLYLYINNRLYKWDAQVPLDIAPFDLPYGTSFTKDALGALWLAVPKKGVFRYNGTDWDDLSAGLPSLQIAKMTPDHLGHLWLTTSDKYLCRWDNGSWAVFDGHNATAQLLFYALAPDREGGVWVWTDSYNNSPGLLYFKDGNWTEKVRNRTEGPRYFSNLSGEMMYFQDKLWLGASDGILTFDGHVDCSLASSLPEAQTPSKNLFTLQPNPADQQVTLRFETPEAQQGVLQVWNSLGQMIFQKKLDPQTPEQEILDTADWPEGLYYLVFSTAKSKSVQKLVVTRF